MAACWIIAVGPVEGVALVADIDPVFIIHMPIIVPVQPSRTHGCLGAGIPEMALAAPDLRLVAKFTILLGLDSVKMIIFLVQPRLAQYMRLTGSVAVVTDSGSGFKGALDLMAVVTHGLFIFVLPVTSQSVYPIRVYWHPAPFGAEMTLETSGNISNSFPVEVMTFHACQGSLGLNLGAVKWQFIDKLRIIPGFRMHLIETRCVGIFF